MIRPAAAPASADSLERLFPGDSELAGRMRAFDWSESDIGPPDTWPPALRLALGICLTSRFPMHVWWGPTLTLFYNDAYVSFLGPMKHPVVLGHAGWEAWSEIWDIIGPMIAKVMTTGEASWSEDILMFFDREIPKEEVYVTFSFSPIFGESGKVDGMFCACTETTEKLVANRRLETLRKLAVRAAEAQTVDEACRTSAEVLAANPRDIPFAAIYVADEGRTRATLSASAGLSEPSPLPPSISLADGEPSPGPMARVLSSHRPEEVSDLAALGLKLPGGPWLEPAPKAFVLPIPGATHDSLTGLLVVGVSPRRVVDLRYRSFLDLVTRHIGTAIADAQAMESERKRAEALAELDQAKTAFFSNVSHEFRTPLTLILAPLEDLLAALPQPDRGSVGPQLEMVYRNALRLQRLVNALLDFSRIEAGRAEASFEPTDLATLTAELAGVFRSAIERAGLKFAVRCEPLPEPVYIDWDMWEKIVLNLLSNAFKFTFDGEIEVVLRPVGKGVQLQVRDSGIGVARDHLPRLFERFHRIESARARTHEGSGIGLAIVQELVKIHGGETRAESEIGKGTTFTISLPFGTAHLPKEHIGIRRTLTSTATRSTAFLGEALRWLPGAESNISMPMPASAAPLTSAPDELYGARILVVEDNPDLREYLARLLAQKWAVEAVPDAEAALAAARSSRFHLILTDVMMPGLDGFGLLKELRADPGLKAIPVIMLSARAGEETRIEGLQSGADDYLTKPFSAREIIARIEAHLKLAARRHAIEANRAKDEFIAMLSHELRNPLSPIITALQLMRMRGNHGHELTIIERQVGQLVRLVDDLLDISRIQRDKIELRKEQVELASVVVVGVEMAGPLLEQWHQRLELEVPLEGLMVECDPNRLAQVISNLLRNAAKYSEPGTKIAVTAARVGNSVQVRVRDEGMGIPPEMLPRIFDIFVQEPQSLARSKGGLGLGLTIVRSLVELHGGTVTAHSEGLGKGSEFIVELPLAGKLAGLERTPAHPMASVRLGVLADPNRNRVLVVDDNSDSAEMMAKVLSEVGYQVEIAHDGPSGLETARRFRPQICLLDLGLPTMDGYELARRLRQASKDLSPDLRLVAITGYGQDSDRRRSQEAGFNAHLVKPVDVDVLVSALST